MSGFFASQLPVDAPRNHTRRKPRERLSPSIKQKADRFESLSNENLHGEYLPVPPATVRLVSSSPSPEPTSTRPSSDNDARRSTSQIRVPQRPRSALLVKDTSVSSPRISAEGRRDGVSEIPAWTNEAQIADYGSSLTLVANDSGHELPKLAFDHWSLSSGNYSQSSTLNDIERRNTDRYSSLGTTSTTTRRTISPVEIEGQDREEPARSGPANTLHTVEESSPERLTTVREVPPSDSSSTERPNSGPSDTSSQSHTASSGQASEQASSEPAPQIGQRRSLKRAYSTGSLRRSPSIYNLREISTSPASHYRDPNNSNWSVISSEAGVSPTSSPNFVSYQTDSASSPLPKGAAIHSSTSIESIGEASSPNFVSYGSDSLHSTPAHRFINNATSIESINSRLQKAHSGPGAHTLNPSSSWASLDEDYDTLPPLHIPKKRARYTSAPLFDHSAFAGVGPSYVAEEMDEEIDTLPFPRRPFSSHLSTIASESDRQSRTASRHMSHFSRLSHFSLGSGVLTGDEESFIAPSPTIAERRRRSLPTDSLVSAAASSAFDEYPTEELTPFREASAIPQPLFKAGQPTMLNTSKKYDGPLPPLPPIPMSHSNEGIDTLSALPSPSLKAQKSSRSLKHQRSRSTPSHSRHPSQISTSDTVRHSAGSSIFPAWAKQFYTGNAVLQSKMSLSSLKGQQSRPTGARHERNESSWTDRSITSRLGTGYSQVEPGSPASSHFLPSIFRPKSWHKAGRDERKLQKSNQSTKSGKSLKSKFSARTATMKSNRSRPESQDAGRDSMAINPHPLSQNPNDSANDVLPSGQPKYGKLRDISESPKVGKQRLPRKYSKQRLWDTMEFPRPMTKDRMSDMESFQEPHLAPATRASQQHLPTWRAPSFVESLDTLIKSRCNRQILLFMLGFVMPIFWMVGAVLPLPKRPVKAEQLEQGGSEEDVQIAMMKHEAGDAEKRWNEEKTYLKARWWRMLNRVMSFVGIGVIGAIVSRVLDVNAVFPSTDWKTDCACCCCHGLSHASLRTFGTHSRLLICPAYLHPSLLRPAIVTTTAARVISFSTIPMSPNSGHNVLYNNASAMHLERRKIQRGGAICRDVWKMIPSLLV